MLKSILKRLGLRAGMIRHESVTHALVTTLLAALVVLGPVRFGGVLPPERAVLDVAAFLALAVVLLRSPRLTLLRPALWPAVSLAAVALFGLLQSVLWPEPLVQLLSPRSAQIWGEAQLLLNGSADEASGSWWLPLSLAPSATRVAAVHWLAVTAAFLAAAAAGAQRGSRRLLGLALAFSAVFQVIYGASAWSHQKAQILGVDVPGDPSRLRGTFVNPDHFAFFTGLAVALAFAWLWWAGRRLMSRRVSVEVGSVRLVLALLLFFLAFIGLGLSGSRSGLLAAFAALAAQGGVLAAKYRRWRGAAWGATGLALGAVTFVLFGYQNFLGRWMETSAYELGWNARVGTWRDTLELWLNFPLTGSGLGSFRFAFPLTQSSEGQLTWVHAHSDWLELLATLGLPAFMVFVLGVGLLLFGLWTAARRGRRSEDRAFALGALGAVVYAVFHSMADFGLTLPANAFALAILCGAALGVPMTQRAKRRSGLTFHLEDEESAKLDAPPRPDGPSARRETRALTSPQFEGSSSTSPGTT